MHEAIVNGRYRVLREVGQGGIGKVLLVEDLHRQNQKLALKTLLHDAVDLKTIERFCIEFAGLSKLRHPHIAAACDFGKIAETGNYYFTTEYVEGIDLFRGTASATTEQILDILVQTLLGLEFIHSNGFLHNDLKPANILLEVCAPRTPRGVKSSPAANPTPEVVPLGRVRIIDFGLFAAENSSWVDLYGTPQFLSPERIRGLPSDRRSDLYSLGFIFYLLFARTLPFNNRDSEAILSMHLDSQVPSLSFFRPDLPAQILALVEKLMCKAPGDRFQSAAETLEFIEENITGRARASQRSQSADLVAHNLFNRESELIYLEECFCTTSALASDTPCVVVFGQSGIGKTRLVRELRGLVQVSGGAYIEVPGREPGATASHAAEVIIRGLETSGVKDFEDLRSALNRSDKDALDVAQLVEKALFRHGRAIPILLHFDDFQRTPAAIRSLAFTIVNAAKEHVAAGAPKSKLLIVLSCSTNDGRGDLTGLENLPSLTLQRFDAEAMRELVIKLFGQDDIPPSTLETIVSCSHGVPGRLIELAQDLVETEIVQHSGSRWVFPSAV